MDVKNAGVADVCGGTGMRGVCGSEGYDEDANVKMHVHGVPSAENEWKNAASENT